MKMRKELEHLSCEKRLRELGTVQPGEEMAQRILLMYVNT